jgi:GNAT superfamily N-acetyltransferase
MPGKRGASCGVPLAMRIEAATRHTTPSVVALLGLQFEEHGIVLPPERLSAAVGALISDPSKGTIFVAFAPDAIGIAVLAYTWTLEHGGLVAWLDELFVRPEYRGRGVGRSLLRRVLEGARAAGCRAIELEVDSEHARVETLYRREGFVPLPRRRWSIPMPPPAAGLR